MVRVLPTSVLLLGSVIATSSCSSPDSELWNSDRTAVVRAFPGATETRVTAFLLQKDGTFIEIDLSAAEDVNFAQLGRHKVKYERFDTKPVEWISRQDGLLEVRIQTQAWRANQRYTASESLIFRHDGSTVWR